MRNIKFIIALLTLISFSSCSVYNFTGTGKIDAKSFQVNYFQNAAALIEPGIERDFTNSLIDLLINQTSLDLVKSNGDLTYEGEITEYRISPTTATANNTAAQNRLTITVNVRFYNRLKEEDDFEKQFSFYSDFDFSALRAAFFSAFFASFFACFFDSLFSRTFLEIWPCILGLI